MGPKWTLYLLIVWAVLSLLGGVAEGAVFGSNSNFAALFSSSFVSKAFWDALFSLLSFKFVFLTGPYEIIRWLLFLPLAITLGIEFTWQLLSHIPVIGRGS